MKIIDMKLFEFALVIFKIRRGVNFESFPIDESKMSHLLRPARTRELDGELCGSVPG